MIRVGRTLRLDDHGPERWEDGRGILLLWWTLNSGAAMISSSGGIDAVEGSQDLASYV